MLNKDEELKLGTIAKRIELEAIGQPSPEYTLDEFYIDIRWLAEKLKEINDECREAHQRSNRLQRDINNS